MLNVRIYRSFPAWLEPRKESTRGDTVNVEDVRKCMNSLELNDFIERYIAEENSQVEGVDGIYWSLFEEWKKTLKKKPAKIL